MYPDKDVMFRAFSMCALEDTKIVIVGQDPYYDGNADGLAFSCMNYESKSLKNIKEEMYNDVNHYRKEYSLDYLASQGVLLLNRILTVEHGLPLSHKGLGWEVFTSTMLKELNYINRKIVYIVWGSNISSLEGLDLSESLVIKSSHPSPRSANISFFGSRPFSRTNEYLVCNNIVPIKW